MKKIFAIICLTIAIISCQPEVVEPNPTPSASSTNNYFISYDVDGNSVSEENSVGNYQMGYFNGSSMDAPNDAISLSPSTGLNNFSDENAHSSRIGFNNHNFVLSEYSSDNAAALATIFTTGNHPFNIEYDGVEGVVFQFSENGVSWSTELMSQASNASFEVTESTSHSDQLQGDQQKVKGNFNCVVYNESGQSKVITNGQFYLNFTAP